MTSSFPTDLSGRLRVSLHDLYPVQRATAERLGASGIDPLQPRRVQALEGQRPHVRGRAITRLEVPAAALQLDVVGPPARLTVPARRYCMLEFLPVAAPTRLPSMVTTIGRPMLPRSHIGSGHRPRERARRASRAGRGAGPRGSLRPLPAATAVPAPAPA